MHFPPKDMPCLEDRGDRLQVGFAYLPAFSSQNEHVRTSSVETLSVSAWRSLFKSCNKMGV